MNIKAHGATRRLPTPVLALAVPVVALIAIIATRVIEGPSSSSAAPAKANAVVIRNFAFAPANPSVAQGTTIKVMNDDGTAHTFSARNGSFNTGDLDGGRSATVKLDRAGSFDFYCKIHNYMTGTLVVR